MSKRLGRSGDGVSEKGEGVGRKGILPSPHPLPLLLIFTPSRGFRLLRERLEKERKRLLRRLSWFRTMFYDLTLSPSVKCQGISVQIENEPRSYMPRWNLTVRVKGVLRTLKCLLRSFDGYCNENVTIKIELCVR